MADIGNVLDNWGGILVGAVGDKVLAGIILEMVSDVTPGDAYQAIISNQTISQVSDADWQKYKGFAKKARLSQMDWDKLLGTVNKQIRKRRPDLYGIIDNMQDNRGWIWLNTQIAGIRDKLTAE